MRLHQALLLGLALLPAFMWAAVSSSQIPGNATGTLEGRVLRYATTEGLANVRITLSGGPARGGAARGATPAARAATTSVPMTDAGGRFKFTDLAPGDYTIRAEHDAYLGIPPSGSVWAPSFSSIRATVTAGQTATELRLYLLRAASISGGVRSKSGAPLAGIAVTAYRQTYADGGRLTFSAADAGKTDERGQYRLFRLAPGPVWIAAASPRLTSSSRIPLTLPVTTFFPNVPNASAALPAMVAEGADLQGMDITMQEQPALTIQGRMTNTLAGAPASSGQISAPAASFYLIPREPSPLGDGLTPAPALVSINRTSGNFEITGVSPGSYDLVAVAPLYAADGARTIFPESVRVDVADKSVSGVSVAIRPGSEVKARVFVDGAEPATPPYVSLRSLEHYAIPFELAAALEVVRDRTGIITFKNVPRGRFAFQVTSLPSNAYVADVQPGPAAYEEGFFVPSESGTIFNISIRTDGGVLRGNVRDVAGKAFSGATVVLVPNQSRRGNAVRYKTARSDGSGTFSFAGVAPGEYKVFAWNDVPPNAWMNAGFLESYEGMGRPVAALGGSTVEADVTVIVTAPR